MVVFDCSAKKIFINDWKYQWLLSFFLTFTVNCYKLFCLLVVCLRDGSSPRFPRKPLPRWYRCFFVGFSYVFTEVQWKKMIHFFWAVSLLLSFFHFWLLKLCKKFLFNYCWTFFLLFLREKILLMACIEEKLKRKYLISKWVSDKKKSDRELYKHWVGWW